MSAYMTTEQIAEMLHVTRRYVTNTLTKRADFPEPCLNLSQRMRRWKESDIRAWMAKSRVQSSRAAMSAADSR
jgi:predicted DNA-binding transcriptional regulator AlpA